MSSLQSGSDLGRLQRRVLQRLIASA